MELSDGDVVYLVDMVALADNLEDLDEILVRIFSCGLTICAQSNFKVDKKALDEVLTFHSFIRKSIDVKVRFNSDKSKKANFTAIAKAVLNVNLIKSRITAESDWDKRPLSHA